MKKEGHAKRSKRKHLLQLRRNKRQGHIRTLAEHRLFKKRVERIKKRRG